jgi:hypothetical protein
MHLTHHFNPQYLEGRVTLKHLVFRLDFHFHKVLFTLAQMTRVVVWKLRRNLAAWSTLGNAYVKNGPAVQTRKCSSLTLKTPVVLASPF